MSNDKKWTALFGIPPRKEESELTQDYMNMALAIQHVTEEIVMKLARTAKDLTGCKNLALAGGVALNSVANGKLLESGMFENIWIQPASGDAGGALGAALAAWHIWKGKERGAVLSGDAMKGALLGPEYKEDAIKKVIRKYNANYRHFTGFDELARLAAGFIAGGKVVGWFQGRMEYGPRALGNRSILGDARNPEMQKTMNLKIKYREGFRPFAPAVTEEDAVDYFTMKTPSPYMLFVVPVNEERRIPVPGGFTDLALLDRLYFVRSDVPAITHIDYSARIQTVGRETNPRFWQLISEFKKTTGCSVIINTSFNVRGEPIVCTPDDAYRCFMRTEMDYLVLGDYLFDKKLQQELRNDDNWKEMLKSD